MQHGDETYSSDCWNCSFCQMDLRLFVARRMNLFSLIRMYLNPTAPNIPAYFFCYAVIFGYLLKWKFWPFTRFHQLFCVPIWVHSPFEGNIMWQSLSPKIIDLYKVYWFSFYCVKYLCDPVKIVPELNTAMQTGSDICFEKLCIYNTRISRASWFERFGLSCSCANACPNVG